MPPFSAIYPARFFYCACISHLCWLCGPVPLRARNHLYPRPKRQNRKTCPQNNKPWPRTANSKATNHLSHNDSAAEKRWDKTGPTEHKKRQTKRVAAKNPPQRAKITKIKATRKTTERAETLPGSNKMPDFFPLRKRFVHRAEKLRSDSFSAKRSSRPTRRNSQENGPYIFCRIAIALALASSTFYLFIYF